MTVKNQVQLITYPDSLGGNLKTLHEVLDKYFSDIFKGGIHILPPFPSSGDRGFAPLTYLEIEPEFGTWDDIRRIGEKHDILLDLMVNHISAKSAYFQDFLKKGRKSEYADLFITIDKIWPDGNPPPEEVEKIFLRRTEPFSEFTIEETGEVEKVWTTFGKVTPSEQIDLDVSSEVTRQLSDRFPDQFQREQGQDRPAGCGRLCDQKARNNLFFCGTGNLSIPGLDHRTGQISWTSNCCPKSMRITPPSTNWLIADTGFMILSSLIWFWRH